MRLRHHRLLQPDLCMQEIDLDASHAPDRGACVDLRGGTSVALFRGGSGVR